MTRRAHDHLARIAAFGVLAFSLVVSPPAGEAAELVMFRQAACEWCDLWDEEIGVIYDKTREAAIAPLRVLDIHDDLPGELAGLKPVVYTPTFVLAEDGREIGRIIGYPGEDFFWGLLAGLLARVTPAACNKEEAPCLR